MFTLNVGVSDKILVPWLTWNKREYMDCSDEGEAVAIGAGYYLATGKKANVFMSADGFCNALNFLTSWIIPGGIKMHLVISTGRTEPPHKIMTDILSDMLKLLPNESENITIEIVRKE